jgi:hypothetical protein
MTYGRHDNLDPYDTPVIALGGCGQLACTGTTQNGSDKEVQLLVWLLRHCSDATGQKQVTRTGRFCYCVGKRGRSRWLPTEPADRTHIRALTDHFRWATRAPGQSPAGDGSLMWVSMRCTGLTWVKGDDTHLSTVLRVDLGGSPRTAVPATSRARYRAGDRKAVFPRMDFGTAH